MSDFKDSTRMIQGHHNWNGNAVWDGRPTQLPQKNPVATTRAGAQGAPMQVPVPVSRAAGGPVPQARDHVHGLHEKGGVRDFHTYGEDHGLVQRSTPITDELQEAGGTTPLRSGFKKGGPARHFHVHHHHHAKGGKITTSTKSYRGHEKKAEAFAEGGHVHNSTHVPAGGPDYKRGGKTKAPVKKNAGGALYATGGTVNKLAMGGPPMGMGALQAPPQGALGRMAMRPQGLPGRPALPMRRPMPMPGPAPAPMGRAKGGRAKK
jgi:hypothetical protein